MAYVPNSNSVVAFQSQPSSLLVGASIIGLTPVAPTPSSVYVLNPVSVLAVNATVLNTPSPSVIAYQAGGSVMAVSGSFSAGNTSVTTFPGAALWITSIVNTVPSSVQVGASIMGTVPVTQVTSPWAITQNSNSIIAIQVAGSVQAVRTDNASVVAVLSNSSVAALQGTNPWLIGNSSVHVMETYLEKNAVTASVMGIPILFKIDETNSVLSAVSPQSPFPVKGSVTALQGTNPWIVSPASGSIVAIQAANSIMQVTILGSVIGASVTTLQGTNPWQVNLVTPSLLSIQPGGSVMNVNVSGSIRAAISNSSVELLSTSASIATLVNNILTGNSSVQLISTSASIQVNMKSQFGANNTWTQNNSVLAMGALRNDTMSSITTADSTYSPITVGPVGENIVANSPITKWVSGATSVMSGTSVQVIAAPGTSIFTYITGVHLTNEASIATRVTLTQGRGAVAASMLTWFVVPAGGGSNAVYMNPIRVLDNNQISASISTVASVYVTVTGFTAKT